MLISPIGSIFHEKVCSDPHVYIIRRASSFRVEQGPDPNGCVTGNHRNSKGCECLKHLLLNKDLDLLRGWSYCLCMKMARVTPFKRQCRNSTDSLMISVPHGRPGGMGEAPKMLTGSARGATPSIGLYLTQPASGQGCSLHVESIEAL